MQIAAVIFDMDGVLLDSEPLHLGALNSVLKPFGHYLSPADNEQFMGRTDEECWRVLMQRYGLPGPLDEYLSTYDAAVLRALRQPLIGTSGAMQLLERLRQDGFRIALASASKRRWIEATLAGLRMTSAFDVVVSGDEVHQGKPDPDLFLLAARRLDVSPAKCAVIEDSPNGLLAAKRAGMMAVALRTPGTAHLSFKDADLIIDTLADWDPRTPTGT